MPGTPTKGRRLGGSSAHQKAMLGQPRCFADRRRGHRDHRGQSQGPAPVAEKIITKAKKGGLHNHRQILSFLRDQEIADKLMEDVGPRYADRSGGYTRILKVGPRYGDNAPMARIELV